MHLTTVHRCPRSFSPARSTSGALSFRPQPWYAEHDVELLLGERRNRTRRPRREVQLAGGGKHPFEQLLIATGSAPRRAAGHRALRKHVRTAHARRRPRTARGALHETKVGRNRNRLHRSRGRGDRQAARGDRDDHRGGGATVEAILGPQLGEWFDDFHRREGSSSVPSARIGALPRARPCTPSSSSKGAGSGATWSWSGSVRTDDLVVARQRARSRGRARRRRGTQAILGILRRVMLAPVRAAAAPMSAPNTGRRQPPRR